MFFVCLCQHVSNPPKFNISGAYPPLVYTMAVTPGVTREKIILELVTVEKSGVRTKKRLTPLYLVNNRINLFFELSTVLRFCYDIDDGMS